MIQPCMYVCACHIASSVTELRGTNRTTNQTLLLADMTSELSPGPACRAPDAMPLVRWMALGPRDARCIEASQSLPWLPELVSDVSDLVTIVAHRLCERLQNNSLLRASNNIICEILLV